MQAVKTLARFAADLAIVALPAVLRDGAAIAGAAILTYGAEQVYRPAGFITGGVLLLGAAIMAGRRIN